MKDVVILIGERLHRLRAERNLSLKDLAKHSGLSKSFLSQVEHGVRSLHVESLAVVAEALKLPIGAFFVATPNDVYALFPSVGATVESGRGHANPRVA